MTEAKTEARTCSRRYTRFRANHNARVEAPGVHMRTRTYELSMGGVFLRGAAPHVMPALLGTVVIDGINPPFTFRCVRSAGRPRGHYPAGIALEFLGASDAQMADLFQLRADATLGATVRDAARPRPSARAAMFASSAKTAALVDEILEAPTAYAVLGLPQGVDIERVSETFARRSRFLKQAYGFPGNRALRFRIRDAINRLCWAEQELGTTMRKLSYDIRGGLVSGDEAAYRIKDAWPTLKGIQTQYGDTRSAASFRAQQLLEAFHLARRENDTRAARHLEYALVLDPLHPEALMELAMLEGPRGSDPWGSFQRLRRASKSD